MIFLRIISCRSSQWTLSPQFTREECHYRFKHQGYHNLHSTRFHIKEIIIDIKGHMSITQKRLRCFSILNKGVTYSHIFYASRRGTSVYLVKIIHSHYTSKKSSTTYLVTPSNLREHINFHTFIYNFIIHYYLK